MWPSVSANTKFCDGATYPLSASVNSVQLRASFTFRNAASVPSSASSAVQRKASGSTAGGFGEVFESALFALIASEISGPCRVTRTFSDDGAAL